MARQKKRPPASSATNAGQDKPQRGATKRHPRSWQYFAYVCLGVAFIALFFSFAWNELWGTVLSKGELSLYSTQPAEVRFEPFALKPTGRVYSLTIYSNLYNTEAWVSGVLETAEGAQVFAVQGDFWQESGPDWVESEQRAREYFVLRQAGSYTVRLAAEPSTAKPYCQGCTAGYELRSGMLYPSYLALFGVLMFIPAFVALYIGKRTA